MTQNSELKQGVSMLKLGLLSTKSSPTVSRQFGYYSSNDP